MDTRREREREMVEERSREKGFSKSESLTGLISLYRRCERMHVDKSRKKEVETV